MLQINKNGKRIKLFIYGFGGFGREFLAQFLDDVQLNSFFVFSGFIDDAYQDAEKQIFSFDKIVNDKRDEKIAVAICIADPFLRENIFKRLSQYKDIIFPNFVFGKSYIKLDNYRGIISCYNSVINVGCSLKDFDIICQGVIIGHDTKLNKFVTLYPNSFIAGHCSLGEYVQCGANSTIIQNKTICSEVFIGAGAVVTKSILVPGKYIGVPSKKML